MKSAGRQGSSGKSDFVICLSDDENAEDNGCEDPSAAALGIATPPSPSPSTSHAKLPIASHGEVMPSNPSAHHGITAAAAGAASPCKSTRASVVSSPSPRAQGVASPTYITSSTSTRGEVPSPGITRSTSPASAMGVTASEGGDDGEGIAKDDGKERPRHASQRSNQARKRNSFIQNLLSTPGCVLVIDNLEVDAQPIDVLGQLMKFSENKEKIHSVHIPPPYPELNRAVGYVVFMNKESADAAAALLTQNFVVSARGRPWMVNRCVQKLNEEDFGFPTISAFQGETQDGNGDSSGGLKIVTDRQEAEYNAAKRRRVVFEQHRRQAQRMFQRHAQEEKDVEANPDLTLYH
ncbi:unnamed protein product [Calypogeia fissa]